MTDRWYFAWDKERLGPFSAAQLMEFGAQGKLQPTDTVWKESIEKGVLADKVKNLFPDPQAEALPAKATVPVANEPWTLEEQLQEIIPEGLMLKVIPEQTDSVFADSPEQTEETVKTSPTWATATDLKPKSPAITNADQPGTQIKPVRKARTIYSMAATSPNPPHYLASGERHENQ